ncbi:hypothetical protein ACF058_02195 [Streptomyces sp. NPDC015501]|uniref:TY-Chap domain-containing protein n=1 Tax=unclassified Streptomyces TaxID=2593676 RepID=UPI0011A8B250|nr:hypothetical protein A3L22_02165 [Streptomyces griseus subsp. griseus]
MEKNTIPRGRWLDDDVFRTLVKEVVPLRPDSWTLADFARATAGLGWELREPRTVGDRIWHRFAPRNGPSYGYGTLVADASAPERIRSLNVSLVDLPEEDVFSVAGRTRAAWWVMEEELGPPTMWGGYSGPWMLWRRPGADAPGGPRPRGLPDLLVHGHDDGRMSLDLLPPGSDADTVGRASVRGRWYAAQPSHLPPDPLSAAPHRPATTWEDVEKRLTRALGSLNRCAPFFPGRFILHLGASRDPQRFVQCWSQDLSLVVEATGYLHHPDSANPAHLARNGWDFSRSIWQRRFPDAMEDREQAAATAARMLIEELRRLGVELADLSYDGTISGRGQGFHLELPDLGIPRVHQPVDG